MVYTVLCNLNGCLIEKVLETFTGVLVWTARLFHLPPPESRSYRDRKRTYFVLLCREGVVESSLGGRKQVVRGGIM